MNLRCITGILVWILYLGFCSGSHAQNAPVTTATTLSNVLPGQQITVPVTVTGFNNIGSITLSLDYDTSKLQYISYTRNPQLSGFFSVGDNNLGNGKRRLILGWFGNGLSLASGSYIVKYNFRYVSGEAQLEWYDAGGQFCEYTNASGTILNDQPSGTYYINGQVIPAVSLHARIFLEGPYQSGSMTKQLNYSSLIPLNQPYSGSPWNYGGTEHVSSIPANCTDWVLVELRTSPDANTKVSTRAGFITNTGLITDLNGIGPLGFPDISSGNYFVVVHHRNHLPVMSANAVPLASSSMLYDFSTGANKVFGGSGSYKLVDPGTSTWGMVAGDATNEGSIFVNDYSDHWMPSFGLTNSYHVADFNMDGNIMIDDYTDFWLPNFGISFILP